MINVSNKLRQVFEMSGILNIIQINDIKEKIS